MTMNGFISEDNKVNVNDRRHQRKGNVWNQDKPDERETPIREEEFYNELHMVTAACTMRLGKYAKRVSEKNSEEMTDTFMGDS
eukprot:4906802-Ditylum_brightwellii.AAC.1